MGFYVIGPIYVVLNYVITTPIQPKLWLQFEETTWGRRKIVKSWVEVFKKPQPNWRWKVKGNNEKLAIIEQECTCLSNQTSSCTHNYWQPDWLQKCTKTISTKARSCIFCKHSWVWTKFLLVLLERQPLSQTIYNTCVFCCV